MFKVDFDVRTDVLHDIEKRFTTDFNTMLGELDYGPVLQWYQQEVNERMVPYPGPVKYPIQWTSEPQRRYYFGVIAKRNSEGKIIPYQRTFGLRNSWDVRLEGDSILIENLAPSGRYVIGNRQQQYHKNTGWIDAEEKAYDILVDTPALDLLGIAVAEWFLRQ